ncbi:fatty acid binding protein 4b [Archocentrus centrarchus]|uniref:fatty acid binding protein 4b n=1 Tax=Archocentrus centrarchus TaxID=63155 RepID=UPI0011E9C90F|nr:fatty acid-binding protein, adipocyte-like [Archocentrus centrarchus]
MAEQFAGKWTLVNSEKFDDYMKAVGVNFATRQIGNLAKPNVEFSMGDDGFITLKSVTTFKTTEFKFKLNEESDEETPDGRTTKTTVTLEDGRLVQKQAWDGKTTRIEREIEDGKLIAKCYMDDVVAVRTYEKAA